MGGGTANTVPGAPTAVAGVRGDAQVVVTWSAPASTGGSPVLGYTVTSSPGDFTAVTSGALTTSVTGLTNGAAYTFTVTATNAVGVGPASEPSTPVTPATVPAAAGDVMATAGNSEATVSWTAPPSNGGAAISGYTVTSTPGGFTATTSGALRASVTGLANGTSYTFTVTVANSVGSGPASAPSNAVMPVTVPGAPGQVAATAGNGQATLTWTAPASNGGGIITGYTVTSSPAGLTATTTGALGVGVTGLLSGTSYTFSVTAKNVAGNGLPSLPSNAVSWNAVPGAPTAVSATSLDGSAQVAWTAPVGNGGTPVTGYTVTSTPGGLIASTTGATAATVSGLTNATSYTFTVKAANAAGAGPSSTPSNAVTPDPLSCPGTIAFGQLPAAVPLTGAASYQPAIAMGDFNGDGKLDVASTVNLVSGSGSISVATGKGDGTFNIPTSYPCRSDPRWLVAGDFDGDGKLDLAVSTFDSAMNVSVLLGNGDGTFKPAVSSAGNWGGMSVGDFDGDGKLDVMQVTSSSLLLLSGNGDGTFKLPNPRALVAAGPLVTADFNGDGKLDVAVGDANPSGATDGGVSILVGDGNGSFQPGALLLGGRAVYGAVRADFNGDGKLDLAVETVVGSFPAIGTASVLLGNGNGTFQSPIDIALPRTGQLIASDVNSDGKLDLLVDDQLLLGNGNGTLNPAVELAGGQVPVAAVDLNADGKADLVMSDTSIALGDGNGTFQVHASYPAVSSVSAFSSGDFNGDHKLDLAVTTNQGGGSVSVLLGNGDGSFQPGVSSPTGANPLAITTGDFDGDGKLDLCAANYSNGELYIMLGYGTGTFHGTLTYAVGAFPRYLVTADFNADGKLDVAVAKGRFGGQDLSILLGNGDGTFQAAVSYGPVQDPASIAVGDFNGDGKLDLVVPDAVNNQIALFLGTGSGTFNPPVMRAAGSLPGASAVADFNGDGKLDLALVSANSGLAGVGDNRVLVLLGNGNGTFQPAASYPVNQLPSGPSSVAAGDFNGDGKADLAVAGAQSVSLLLGTGTGTFAAAVNYPAGAPTSIVSADFNRDGKPDWAVASGSGRIDILLRGVCLP